MTVAGDVRTIGRWTSIAADDKRVLVDDDQINGDLVFVDATKQTDLKLRAVDGVLMSRDHIPMAIAAASKIRPERRCVDIDRDVRRPPPSHIRIEMKAC
jgi:hypothetical protein